MATFTHTCPHCFTGHIALKIVFTTFLNQHDWCIYLRCPKCRYPSCATIRIANALGADVEGLVRSDSDITHFYHLRDFWPEPPKPLVPDMLPPNVVRIYVQAERNFSIEGNEEAAGTMYGKALDIALMQIDPTLKGMLGSKIKTLSKAGKLTHDLAEWSDEIRDIRNDAAHEEISITRGELIALRNFSEMVLRYLFSLPNAVKKRRGEALPWEKDGGGPVSA